MLLYGVPFHYLVPDEKMLPAESIRYFYLNPEWLNCLLQGACSVGRSSQDDELVDQLLRANFFYCSEKMAEQLRSNAKLAADERRNGTDEKTKPVEEKKKPVAETEGPTTAVLNWPLSGYLLRSLAVESWIGLEATAQRLEPSTKTLEPLQILRMDRLGPDILLCIYNGKVETIEVKQPPEAMHFGATSKAEGGHEKTGLRRIRKIKPDDNTMGDMLLTSQVDVPTYEKRVVNVVELAANIKTQLIAKAQLAVNGPFTSAEFAVQMIESPAKVMFTVQ
jgi:hypothetical protein